MLKSKIAIRIVFHCTIAMMITSAGNLFAQGGGAGAAFNAYQYQPQPAVQQSYANTSEFVVVTGTAEVSVKPEGLRLVFAVTSEEESSIGCSSKVKDSIEKIRTETRQIGIADSDVVEDFIVVVPTYIWKLEMFDKSQFVKEYPKGFRMQTNLHVSCKDEKQALAVINAAFRAGVTEIISFDYWHSAIDPFKQQALKSALDQAKSKSDILLTVFDDKPKVLNVSNTIKVSYPESLYKTIAPTPQNNQVVMPSKWHGFLKIFAHRPKATFYAGSKEYADASAQRPPMNPEISVISSVTLTFGSPAREERQELERLKATSSEKSE